MHGKTINGFVLRQRLGQGGMGEVWLAENSIGKKAAVKLLLDYNATEKELLRFKNEAKIMVQLEHPNIRQVYDYSYIDGRPCIVMEYLEGSDLGSLMAQGKRFSDNELKTWWNQTVRALNCMHSKGIVHRDLKPHNLFLDKNGVIKVLDFGIAKLNDSTLTETTSCFGTRYFMSPEQVLSTKNVDGRSDYYSLAMTFVSLITGTIPYLGLSTYEMMTKILYTPSDLSGVPTQWRDFLKPYLEKEPNNRSYLREFEMPSVLSSSRSIFIGNNHRGSNVSDATRSLESLSAGDNSKQFDDLVVPVRGILLVMKYVEGGTFWMGNNDGDGNTRPIHKVTLSSFYLGETKVSQALWSAVMDSGSNYIHNVYVKKNWNECIAFTNSLNHITGKQFRLPTEAEWEFAAKGGREKGNQVRRYSVPNELGLKNMIHEEYEWCNDYYDTYSDLPQINPHGPSGGYRRVQRGGPYSWSETYRSCGSPNEDCCFRLCLSQ